jgi:hypothetical protein
MFVDTSCIERRKGVLARQKKLTCTIICDVTMLYLIYQSELMLLHCHIYGDNTDQQSLSDGACRFGQEHPGVLKASVPVGCLVHLTDEGYHLYRSPRTQANMASSSRREYIGLWKVLVVSCFEIAFSQ